MDPQFYQNLFTISELNLHRAVQGGALIALASSVYYFLFGGILGMSGMAGSVVKFPTSKHHNNTRIINHAQSYCSPGFSICFSSYQLSLLITSFKSTPFRPTRNNPQLINHSSSNFRLTRRCRH